MIIVLQGIEFECDGNFYAGHRGYRDKNDQWQEGEPSDVDNFRIKVVGFDVTNIVAEWVYEHLKEEYIARRWSERIA